MPLLVLPELYQIWIENLDLTVKSGKDVVVILSSKLRYVDAILGEEGGEEEGLLELKIVVLFLKGL